GPDTLRSARSIAKRPSQAATQRRCKVVHQWRKHHRFLYVRCFCQAGHEPCLPPPRDTFIFQAVPETVQGYNTGGMQHMNREGFTLIELLIVVVIIGILAAIAIPKFANTKGKVYIASMKSDLRNLVTAEDAFFADSVKYSAKVKELVDGEACALEVRDVAWRPTTGHTASAPVVADSAWTTQISN